MVDLKKLPPELQSGLDAFSQAFNRKIDGIKRKIMSLEVEKVFGEKVFAPVRAIAEQLESDKLKKSSKGLTSMFGSMMKTSVIGKIFELMGPMMEALLLPLELLAPLFDIIAAIITAALVPILKMLMPFIMILVDILAQAIPYLNKINGIFGLLMLAWEGILWLWDNVFKPIWDGILWVFNAIGDVIATYVMPVLQGLFDFFEIVVDVIMNVFGIFGNIGKAIGDVFKSLFDGIKSIINGFIKAINFAIDIINAIPGVNIKKIPKLAEGGIVHGPMLALLGDNPSGVEKVTPLEKDRSVSVSEDILFELRQQRYLLEDISQVQRKSRRGVERRVSFQ